MENFLKELSTFHKRILSALILGPLTLWILIIGGFPFMAFIVVGGAISLYEFFRMEQAGANLRRNMAIWVAYTLVCAIAFLKLRLGFDNGVDLVLAVMLTVWASDIGAYFTGKMIGGPKMTPRLSPKKTWSGLVGGMVCSGLTLLIYNACRDIFVAHSAIVFLTGFVLGAVGQAGDLLISSIKRRVGVKDTGHIIPGHGGLLDRIDSLLLVIPVFLLVYLALLT